LFKDDKLISIIKENFDNEDNKLFELSFNLHMNSQNNPNDFIIDLDNIYKWVGFSRKDHAKHLLVKEFTKNIDYKISLPKLRERPSDRISKGGENKEEILLTINCFKKYCLKASTSNSNKIYDYYIKIENIIFKYIQEQYINQSNIILEKDKIISEKDQFILSNFNKNNNLKYEDIEKTQHLYILSTDIDKVYKIGESNDVKQRRNALQTACVKDIDIIYDYLTSNKKILEEIVHDILAYYRCKSKREHFRCDLNYIKDIINISGLFFDTLKSTYANISRKEIIDKLIDKLNKYLQISDTSNNTIRGTISDTSNNTIDNISNKEPILPGTINICIGPNKHPYLKYQYYIDGKNERRTMKITDNDLQSQVNKFIETKILPHSVLSKMLPDPPYIVIQNGWTIESFMNKFT
jgi:hypothetical protein